MRDVESEVSPDGVVRIEYAVSEVRHSHFVRAPRVIRVSDGAILLDLWGTVWDGTARFPPGAEGALFLALRCYPGDTPGFTVCIDPRVSTGGAFAFADRMDRPEPLASLRARLEERHLDQMAQKALEDARDRVRKRQKGARAIVERLETLIAFRRGEGFLDDELELAPLFEPHGTAEDTSFLWLLERIDLALRGADEDG